MPEGHTIRRLALDLNEVFAGRTVRLSSPQGRFASEAAALDNAEFERSTSAGKHLFIEFSAERFVHVHLGLIGTFLVAAGLAPPPIGAIRLRLETPSAYADLRGAITCDLVGPTRKAEVVAGLGPDPLDPAADVSVGWAKVSKSGRPIGDLLMDQKIFAGVGNVYRAEVLFRQRIHPLRPGKSLRRKQFDAIWRDLVELLAAGVEVNRIDTVRPEHTPEVMGRQPRVDDHGGEVYVYRRAGMPCYVCERLIKTEPLASRNLFWCPGCQPPYRARLT
jgi:endonuclease VIII